MVTILPSQSPCDAITGDLPRLDVFVFYIANEVSLGATGQAMCIVSSQQRIICPTPTAFSNLIFRRLILSKGHAADHNHGHRHQLSIEPSIPNGAVTTEVFFIAPLLYYLRLIDDRLTRYSSTRPTPVYLHHPSLIVVLLSILLIALR